MANLFSHSTLFSAVREKQMSWAEWSRNSHNTNITNIKPRSTKIEHQKYCYPEGLETTQGEACLRHGWILYCPRAKKYELVSNQKVFFFANPLSLGAQNCQTRSR
jgi:hypothetical protein